MKDIIAAPTAKRAAAVKSYVGALASLVTVACSSAAPTNTEPAEGAALAMSSVADTDTADADSLTSDGAQLWRSSRDGITVAFPHEWRAATQLEDDAVLVARAAPNQRRLPLCAIHLVSGPAAMSQTAANARTERATAGGLTIGFEPNIDILSFSHERIDGIAVASVSFEFDVRGGRARAERRAFAFASAGELRAYTLHCATTSPATPTDLAAMRSVINSLRFRD